MWDPSGNAVHRLIAYLDALAIAFNRFRQLSFHLPICSPPAPFDTPEWQAGVSGLLADFDAIREAVFPPGADLTPHHRAERLTDEAIAEFARAWAMDEATRSAVGDAAGWVGLVGNGLLIGTPRPWDYGVYTALDQHRTLEKTRSREVKFDREGDELARYTPIRRALLSSLARIGQTVDVRIDRRATLAFHAWGRDPIELLGSGQTIFDVIGRKKGPSEGDPPTQEELLAMVQEAEPRGNATALRPADAESRPPEALDSLDLLLDDAIRLRDRLDDPTELDQAADFLSIWLGVSVRGFYLRAVDFQLVRPAEATEVLLTLDGAKRKLDDLIGRLRTAVSNCHRPAAAVQPEPTSPPVPENTHSTSRPVLPRSENDAPDPCNHTVSDPMSELDLSAVSRHALEFVSTVREAGWFAPDDPAMNVMPIDGLPYMAFGMLVDPLRQWAQAINPRRQSLAELDRLAGLWGASTERLGVGVWHDNDQVNALLCLIASFGWVLRFLNAEALCETGEWSPQFPSRHLPEQLLISIWDAASAIRDEGRMTLGRPPGWPNPKRLGLTEAATVARDLVFNAWQIEQNISRHRSPSVDSDHELFKLWGHLEWCNQQLPHGGYEACYPDLAWCDADISGPCAHDAVPHIRDAISLTLGFVALETRSGGQIKGRVGFPWFIPFWTPEARPLADGKLPKLNKGRWNSQLMIESEKLKKQPAQTGHLLALNVEREVHKETVSGSNPTIWRHAPGSYSVDRANQYRVNSEEDNILTAFAESPVAMSSEELKNSSGVTNVSRVIKELSTRYGGVFEPAIRRPTKKGEGGYFIRVCDAMQKPT